MIVAEAQRQATQAITASGVIPVFAVRLLSGCPDEAPEAVRNAVGIPAGATWADVIRRYELLAS